MARNFNGTTDEIDGSSITLISGATVFTVMVRYKATTVNKASQVVLLRNGTGVSGWTVRHNGTVVEFLSVGGIAHSAQLVVGDATDWHTYIWRFRAGGEYAGFVDGEKTVFHASASGAVATVTGATLDIGHAEGTLNCPGGLEDFAVWNVFLVDEIVAELSRGVSPHLFPQGQEARFALNGNNSPEVGTYNGARATLTVTGTSTITGSRRVPWKYRTRVEPVWLVDVYHDSTISAASRDLYDDEDYDVLGQVYPHRLARDFTLLESLPDAGGVIEYGQCVLAVSSADGGFDLTEDYHGAGVRIRKYDRVSHALTTEFVGFVDHQVETAATEMRFDCRSDDPMLRQLIPRATTEFSQDGALGFLNADDPTTRPSDTGVPIPLVCGSGGLSAAPFLRTVEEDLGGQEFLAGWSGDVKVLAAYADTDAQQSGLERQPLWEDAPPGNPSYSLTGRFAVTNQADMAQWYTVGMQVRQSTDSGATWTVMKITNVNLPNIDVSPASLSSPLSNGTTRLFQIDAELIVEDDAWELVDGTGTTALTTILDPGAPIGRLMLELESPYNAHPVDLLNFMIENPSMGAAGGATASTLNNDDYTAAYTAMSAAGFGAAVQAVLGGDRTQRTLRDWINQLAIMRGWRMWRDNLTEWRLTVDTAAAAPRLLVGYGAEADDRPNNLLSAPSYDYIPDSESVSTLKLLYARGGRSRGGKSLIEEDYAFRTQMSVHPRGREMLIPSLLIRNHNVAARATWYIGKRLEHARRRGSLVTDHDGWSVAVGELVSDVNQGLDFRVTRKQQTLTTYTLGVAGHNDEIYETNINTILADVATPTAQGNPDTRPGTAAGGNLVTNPDFSTGLLGSARAPHANLIPGWTLLTPADFGTAMAVTSDPDAVGGFYLSFTTPGTLTGTPSMVTPGSPTGIFGTPGFSSRTNVPFIFSAYVNHTSAGGATTGFDVYAVWYNGLSIVHSPGTLLHLKTFPGDVSQKGWRRVWGRAYPPSASARNVQFWILPRLVSTTYRFDAIMVEHQVALVNRPSPWRPNVRSGIQPVQILPGDITQRVPGSPLHGMVLSSTASTDYATGGTTLSGTSTTLTTHGGGLLKAISGRVTVAITLSAGTTWQIREGSTTGRILVADIPIADETTFDDDDNRFASPVRIPALTPIIARPTTDGASFTAGKVKAALHVERAQPPEEV